MNQLYEKYKQVIKIEYKETLPSGKVRIITEEMLGIGIQYAGLYEIEEVRDY